MEEIYIYNLLKKLVENNITDLEFKQLQQVLLNPEFEPVIKKFMDQIWNRIDDSEPLVNPNSEALYQKIILDQRVLSTGYSNIKPLRKTFYWKSVAAAILLIVTLGAIVRKAVNNSAPVIYSEYGTSAAQHLKINLPDGSKVWLNAQSIIRFPKSFRGNSRDIYLEGEAFFDVVHDVRRPFKVYTGGVCTQVLGTAFNISAYKELIEVTVLRGKVNVQTGGKQLGMLTPNKQLDYNITSKTVNEHTVDAASYTAWAGDGLVLNNVSMAEAAGMISKWFKVKIVFKNPDLKNCRFVATFPNNVKLDQVMKIISKLNDFRYLINNNTVYISGPGCYTK